MKPIIYGTRTLARKYGIARDAIRDMIDRREISPSTLKRNNVMTYAFDNKEQKKVEKMIKAKQKTGFRRSFVQCG